jgi:hypothetical protein
VLVNKSASKKEKTTTRRLPPHRILKLLPYQKQQSFPVTTKVQTRPSLLLLSTTPKTTAPVTIAEIAEMRLKKLTRKFIFSQCQLLSFALSPPNNFSSEKPATTFEHKKNPRPNSPPKHARSPTLLGIL